jgi:hypothetical protein
VKAIGTKQQDRSERAAALLLDNQTQDIQDLLERFRTNECGGPTAALTFYCKYGPAF